MSNDRLPDHLTRVAYVEEKTTLHTLKMMALADRSSVSVLIRKATEALVQKADPDGKLEGEFRRITGIRRSGQGRKGEEAERPTPASKSDKSEPRGRRRTPRGAAQ